MAEKPFARFIVDVDPAIWVIGAVQWARKIDNAIDNVLSERQIEMEQYMKQNAPWQDVTGRARASLYTNVQRNIGEWVLEFRYTNSIDYARYLEYDHAGKFSILTPTMDYYFPIILQDLQDIVSD